MCIDSVYSMLYSAYAQDIYSSIPSQICHDLVDMLFNCLFLFKDRIGNWIAIFLGIYEC